MSEFTNGKWEARSNGAISLSDGKWYIPCGMSEHIELDANARLIAAAPEMYRLLCEFLKIDEQKAWATTEKNDPAYMMALVAQDGAVNMAKELLARIDGKEPQS